MQAQAATALSTTTLTAFEWALIVGLGGLFTLALGFFLSRLIRTLDRLDEALNGLRVTLAEEYVTKADLKEALQDLKAALQMRRAPDCPQPACPLREDS